ncbi:MAG: thioesterase family protein [Pseudomonadota bacterium]
MKYTDLLASIKRESATQLQVNTPENWMQGRTIYGGLSAALCYEAARPLAGDRPLRSAQIAFVGPAGGDLRANASLLREGKNTAYITADLSGENGIGSHATFVFGAHRDSPINHWNAPELPSDAGEPEEKTSFFPEGVGPAFTQQFDIQFAFGSVPMSGAETADLGLWMRHKDRAAPDDITALLAIGDTPPPAAMALLSGPARISSMNWSIDVVAENADTENGWYFARHTAETLRNGYSAQNMTLWNRAGKPIMLSRQTIAVFD